MRRASRGRLVNRSNLIGTRRAGTSPARFTALSPGAPERGRGTRHAALPGEGGGFARGGGREMPRSRAKRGWHGGCSSPGRRRRRGWTGRRSELTTRRRIRRARSGWRRLEHRRCARREPEVPLFSRGGADGGCGRRAGRRQEAAALYAGGEVRPGGGRSASATSEGSVVALGWALLSVLPGPNPKHHRQTRIRSKRTFMSIDLPRSASHLYKWSQSSTVSHSST